MLTPFFVGKGGRKLTPEEVDRERELVALARAKMGDTSPVGHWTQGATRVVDALGAVLREKRTNKAEAAGLAGADERIAAILAGQGGGFGGSGSYTASTAGQGAPGVVAPVPAAAPAADPSYALGVDALPQSPTTPGGFSMGTPVAAGVDPALAARYAIPEEVKNGIFAGESGGDYDALFGFQNRPGGKFQNVKLTDMTIDDALNFAAPSGEYGQTVKGQIGRVATPMGGYQIVGTTLRAAKEGLGLTGNEVMTPEMQDVLGGWILANQGTGAWEGYKGPRDGYTPASGGPATFSGAGGAPAVPGGAGGLDIASLLALQSDPWVAKKYGGVVDALMGQQFSRQNALWEQQQKMADPMYQAQLAELTAPQAREPIKVGDKLIDPLTYEVIGDYGTPEPGWVDLTPEQIAAQGLAPGPWQRGPNNELKLAGGGGTKVDIDLGGGENPDLGKLSTDYGYLTNPDGSIKRDPVTGLAIAAPVPGSPAAADAQTAEEKAALRDTQAANSAEIVLQDIDKAIEQTSGWTAGAGGALFGMIPGSSARDLQGSLNTIVANIGFDRLQQMREASPTGGALGGIAVPELVMLQAVLGSLTADQSPEQLKANLKRLKDVYEPIARKAAAYPNAGEFGFSGGGTETPTRGGDAGAPPTGNKTSSGVQWSIEP